MGGPSVECPSKSANLQATMAARAMIVALCAVALMGAVANARAGTGANGRVREEAAREALASLRNVSDAQVAALRSAALLAAQEVTRFLIGRFQQMTGMTETETEEMLAKWEALETAAAAEKAAAGGRRSAVDGCDGDGDDDLGCFAEFIQRVIREGWESQGIPPLDPVNISYIPVDVDVPDVLRLQGKLEDLSFDGLASFRDDEFLEVILGIFAITAPVNFDVLFPRLRVRTQYAAEGSTDAGLDIWGDGLIEILLYGLRVKGDIKIRVPVSIIGVPTVDPCEISVAATSLKFKIEGLFGDLQLSELASETITNNINDEYVWDALFDSISTTVEDGVCGYLRSLSRLDYVKIYVMLFVSENAPCRKETEEIK